MTEHIDTSKGWREVPSGPSRQQRLALITDGVIDKMWVREDSVPSLPTEPWTVIRARWKAGGGYTLVLVEDSWYFAASEDHLTPETLASKITGFEVVSEPRTVTVKDVVDYLHQLPDYYGEDRVAREFGVAADSV